MSMLRAHWLMHQLHRALGNPKASQQHASSFDRYLRDLSLYCGSCHEVIGNKQCSLHVLACCHIFHARSVTKAYRTVQNECRVML